MLVEGGAQYVEGKSVTLRLDWRRLVGTFTYSAVTGLVMALVLALLPLGRIRWPGILVLWVATTVVTCWRDVRRPAEHGTDRTPSPDAPRAENIGRLAEDRTQRRRAGR